MFKIHFLGEYVSLCEKLSCKHTCGEIGIRRLCSCHISCITYNSCCYDFGKVCTITNISISGASERHHTSSLDAYVPPMTEKYLYSTCEQVRNNKTASSITYSFITRCPNNTGMGIKSLCEDTPSGHDLRRFVPVSTNESLYRNLYCAQCHGLVLKDVVFWKPDFKCDRTLPMISSMKDYIKYFLSFCFLTLTPPIYGVPVEAAICQSFGTDTCPRVRTDGTVNTRSIISACTRYSAPVQHPGSFKNPHCAICNGNHRDLVCQDEPDPVSNPYDPIFYYPSYSLLMDLKGGSGISIKAEFGERQSLILCNRHEIFLDGECVKPDTTTSCLPQMRNNSDQRIYFNLNVTIKKLRHLDRISKSILNSIKSKTHGSLIQDSQMGNQCSKLSTKYWKCSRVYLVIHSRQYLIELIEQLLTYFEYEFVMEYKVDINLYLTNHNFVRNTSCQFGVFNTYSSDDVEIIRRDSEEYTFITSKQTMFKLKDVYLFVNLFVLNSNIRVKETSYSVSMCETKVLNCSKIYLEPVAYTLQSDGSIRIEKSGVVTSEFEMCGHRAVVCADLLNRDRNYSPRLQGELTLAGNCISEAFLAYTLIVHAMFPSLRTVPGRCVMALSLSLFLAQLMFQVSSLATGIHPVCIFMACVQHYFWLSSFCWMSVLAFDYSSAFSGSGKLTGSSQREKNFILFNIYAWCVPAAVVITSLVMQFGNGMSIYANGSFCWVNGTQNLLIFFVAPLAFTVCCNLVFFIRCVVGIVRTRKVTQKARPGYKLDLFIYVKISSLMGFTWISGFLANAVPIDEFWYVFIVCNTLQGVAIGVAFAMSPRVLKMIWGRCRGKKD